MTKPTISLVAGQLTFKKLNEAVDRFHDAYKYWPTYAATEDEFLAAGVEGASGPILHECIQNGKGLERDQEYLDWHRLVYKAYRADPNLRTFCENRKVGMTGDDFDELLKSVVVEVKTSRQSGARSTAQNESFWLDCHAFAKPIFAEAGVQEALAACTRANVTLDIRIPHSRTIEKYLETLALVPQPGKVTDGFYISLSEQGDAEFKYFAINGRRFIAESSTQQIDQLRLRISEGIKQAASHFQTWGASPRSANDPAIAVGPSVVLASSQLTYEEEVETLTVSGQEILLPKQQLNHYQSIKDAVEKAGGKYLSGRYRFRFAPGINPHEVLGAMKEGRTVNYKQEYQFFKTSREEIDELLARLPPDLSGWRFLEPSAGQGAIAEVLRMRGAEVVTVELWHANAIVLRQKGFDPIERDFLSITPDELGKFDAVLANPPFSRNQDIDHFIHMTKFLKPGGYLASIMSPAWRRGTQARHREFMSVLDALGASIEDIAPGAFKAAGTSVPTVRVVIESYRPEVSATANEQPAARPRMRA